MAKLCVGRMVLGPVETNCYIVHYADSKKCIIVDPPKSGIYDRVTKGGLEPVAVLLTHGHFDHITGCDELQNKGVKVYALDKERDVLRSTALNASEGTLCPCAVEADGFFSDGEEVTIADMKFKVIATPGHTKGSCCYYFEDDKVMLTGDTLFHGSVGRSDLPTGSDNDIILSARKLVKNYPKDVQIYPGHGDFSTLGYERTCNPFCI